MIKICRKKKIVIYSLILLLSVAKIISINKEKLDLFLSRSKYQSITREYKRISSYEEFKKKSNQIEVIYFGSLECNHCLNNINIVNDILSKYANVYYFSVDYDKQDNLNELEEFQRMFHFDTIPHIVIFSENQVSHYSSGDITELSK